MRTLEEILATIKGIESVLYNIRQVESDLERILDKVGDAVLELKRVIERQHD